MTGRGLVVFAAVAIAAALTACSSSPARPHSGTESASSPTPSASGVGSGSARSGQSGGLAAYRRIGGTAQGVSLEVPSSWKDVDFSQQTVKQALGIIGAGQGTIQTSLTQELDPLAKLRAVYAADVSSATGSPGHFITNINAYCSSSGISLAGSTGVAVIGRTWATELQQVGALNLTQTAVRLGGVAGVQSAYALSTASAGMLHAVQLQVLPKPGRACYVTLTAAGPVPPAALSEAISTIRYP